MAKQPSGRVGRQAFRHQTARVLPDGLRTCHFQSAPTARTRNRRDLADLEHRGALFFVFFFSIPTVISASCVARSSQSPATRAMCRRQVDGSTLGSA